MSPTVCRTGKNVPNEPPVADFQTPKNGSNALSSTVIVLRPSPGETQKTCLLSLHLSLTLLLIVANSAEPGTADNYSKRHIKSQRNKTTNFWIPSVAVQGGAVQWTGEIKEANFPSPLSLCLQPLQRETRSWLSE